MDDWQIGSGEDRWVEGLDLDCWWLDEKGRATALVGRTGLRVAGYVISVLLSLPKLGGQEGAEGTGRQRLA